MKSANQLSLSIAIIASGFFLTSTLASASVASHWLEEKQVAQNNDSLPVTIPGKSADELARDAADASPLTPVVKPPEIKAPETTLVEVPTNKKLSKKEAAAKKKAEKEAAKQAAKQTEEEKLLGSKNVSDPDQPTLVMPQEVDLPPGSVDPKFKAALEYVYANHPQIKAQREVVKIADEGVAQAVSGFRPNASVNFSKGRERIGDVSQRWNYDATKSRTLSVEQPVFSGGGTVASFMAAKANVKAARANLSATIQQVLYDAVVAYTDVVEKQSVLELNKQNVEVLQRQMDVTNARFKVGELTLTDVSQAKARLAGAQASEKQAQGDLEGSRATYRRTIGYDAESKITMPPVPGNIPASLNQSQELAMSNNPILKAAHYNEKAAGDTVYIRGATLLPNVSLQGAMSRADGSSLSGLNKIDEDSIRLNINIPIYQSGAEWSRLREARNAAQQAKFNAFDTHESVVESVNIAWESYITSKAIIVSNQAAVDAAETALNGVRKENEFGVRTILDVLNAEQETFSAHVNLIRAIRTEKLQAYRLLATVGKLTGKDLGLKSDVEDPKEHYNSVKYQLLGL